MYVFTCIVVKFVYFTSVTNSPRYVKLTAVPGSQNDIIVATEDVQLTTVLSKLEAVLLTSMCHTIHYITFYLTLVTISSQGLAI